MLYFLNFYCNVFSSGGEYSPLTARGEEGRGAEVVEELRFSGRTGLSSQSGVSRLLKVGLDTLSAILVVFADSEVEQCFCCLRRLIPLDTDLQSR
jgi:hypothetical protein